MPEDSVFDTKQPEAEKPAEAAAQAQPAAGPSAEDIATALDAKIDEKLGPIQRSNQELTQFLSQLKDQAAAQTPPADPNAEDFATRFYNEPEGTVEEKINSVTGPAVAQVAETMGKMLISQQKISVDAEFGDGTWDEVFEGPISKAVADAVKNYPMSLMSDKPISNAVKTIKGDNFGALVERTTKQAEKANAGPSEEVVEAVRNRVVQELGGGIRRVRGDAVEKFDDEESQTFLDSFFRETGERIDTKRLAKLVNTGNTIDDWEAATKEDK